MPQNGWPRELEGHTKGHVRTTVTLGTWRIQSRPRWILSAQNPLTGPFGVLWGFINTCVRRTDKKGHPFFWSAPLQQGRIANIF
jgi:hypothetical protein